jgi:hypothetical protein
MGRIIIKWISDKWGVSLCPGFDWVRVQVTRWCSFNFHIVVSWARTPCSMADGYRGFEGTYCLHLQSWTMRMEAVCSSKVRGVTRQSPQWESSRPWKAQSLLISRGPQNARRLRWNWATRTCLSKVDTRRAIYRKLQKVTWRSLQIPAFHHIECPDIRNEVTNAGNSNDLFRNWQTHFSSNDSKEFRTGVNNYFRGELYTQLR